MWCLPVGIIFPNRRRRLLNQSAAIIIHISKPDSSQSPETPRTDRYCGRSDWQGTAPLQLWLSWYVFFDKVLDTQPSGKSLNFHFRRKQKIRTLLLSRNGSDFHGLVRWKGLEPPAYWFVEGLCTLFHVSGCRYLYGFIVVFISLRAHLFLFVAAK